MHYSALQKRSADPPTPLKRIRVPRLKGEAGEYCGDPCLNLRSKRPSAFASPSAPLRQICRPARVRNALRNSLRNMQKFHGTAARDVIPMSQHARGLTAFSRALVLANKTAGSRAFSAA
jgi:hypothetical protein